MSEHKQKKIKAYFPGKTCDFCDFDWVSRECTAQTMRYDPESLIVFPGV